MNRFVTSDDLTLLSTKAFALAKLAESARRVDAGKGDITTLHELIERDQKRLGTGSLRKKRRGKIERNLQYHQELLYYTELKAAKKAPKFSQAISRIESVLRELAEMYEGLANVHRFEHG